jgi:hypothetical protein
MSHLLQTFVNISSFISALHFMFIRTKMLIGFSKPHVQTSLAKSYSFYFCGEGAVLEFKLRTLLGRCCATGATPPKLFALGIFQIGSHFYARAGLDSDPSIFVAHRAGMCTTMSSFLLEFVKFFARADLKLQSS